MAEKRSKTSLAFRLNATLFFRQLRTMLWLDIVICALFAAGLFYYTETTAYELIREYTKAAALGTGTLGTGALGAGRNTGGNQPGELAPGYTLSWSSTQPRALFLPELSRRLPEPLNQEKVGRWLYYDGAALHWREQMKSAVYQMTLPSDGGWLVVTAAIGRPLFVFYYCFAVILALEALSLLASLSRNGRSINRTLKPLQDLTASTQALTAKGGRLSPEALKRLTGALDSINVSHLDTGLPLTGISDELKPLAEAINEMLARIDEAYHSQVRFVSDASHELRTPIAVIQGYANLLTRWGTEDPETMRESIQAIRQEADAMKEMVEQLLFLARGDNDSMHIDWQAVDISALAAEVLREVEMIDGGHCFAASIAAGVTVEGDDGLLKQLMRILVDNSIKYTPADGEIILRVEERGGQAAIVVQDEGAGIPEEAMPHIFDRFFRADESRTRNTGGTGLGLSIAKWIAQRHNGLIEVVSRQNIGTRMTVLLPAVKART
ncbi:MAG: ATP-binding protein [Clostridiales bacterium]